jgi:hypothetical protein
VIRLNRDTMYFVGQRFVFNSTPAVTVTLTDNGKRFMSMQVISRGHYVPAVVLHRRRGTR